jgi:hypothetical protein
LALPAGAGRPAPSAKSSNSANKPTDTPRNNLRTAGAGVSLGMVGA